MRKGFAIKHISINEAIMHVISIMFDIAPNRKEHANIIGSIIALKIARLMISPIVNFSLVRDTSILP